MFARLARDATNRLWFLVVCSSALAAPQAHRLSHSIGALWICADNMASEMARRDASTGHGGYGVAPLEARDDDTEIGS
jgi:hypothetical protein